MNVFLHSVDVCCGLYKKKKRDRSTLVEMLLMANQETWFVCGYSLPFLKC